MPGIQPTNTPLSNITSHDVSNFDIDSITGFMPLHQPISRLSEPWNAWEGILDEAIHSQLKLGDSKDLTEEDIQRNESWRKKAREVDSLLFIL